MVAAITAVLIAVLAWPALASHTVSWGIDSPDGPRTAETGDPTTFVVSVSFDGQPMGGWPMTARVFDAAGDLVDEIQFSTDGAGVGEFTVPAPGEGDGWIVSVCDDDGCVYGDATLTAPAPPPSEPPVESEEPTPTEEPTPEETASQPTEEEPSEIAVNPEPASTNDSNRTWILTGGAGGLLVLVGAALFFGGTRPRRGRGTTTDESDDE